MHFGDQNYHHLNVIWTNTIQQIPISTEWYVALKADGWENTQHLFVLIADELVLIFIVFGAAKRSVLKLQH